MTDPAPFTLAAPDAPSSPVLFAAPHSGRAYPRWLLDHSPLDPLALRSSEDAYVDQLFDCAPDFGAPLLCAKTPRAVVDLNRAPTELDPAVIEDVPNARLSARIAAGLGVIPRVVGGERAIYRGKISLTEALARLDAHWHPYHARLDALLTQTQAQFGQAILIDCHSMPHIALDGVRGAKPQIVLGDRYGRAAHPDITDRIEAAFVAQGFTVARNVPFAGAYILETYGAPHRGIHAVQVEIDRALYLEDEATLTKTPGFDRLRGRLRAVVQQITQDARPEQQDLAAE